MKVVTTARRRPLSARCDTIINCHLQTNAHRTGTTTKLATLFFSWTTLLVVVVLGYYPHTTSAFSASFRKKVKVVASEPNVVVVPEDETNRRRRRSRGQQKSSADDLFLFRSMIQHDILTKEQEFELGEAIQTAKKLQEKLDLLLQQKRDQEQLDNGSMMMQPNDDDSITSSSLDDLELSHLSVYGGATTLNDYDLHYDDHFSRTQARLRIQRESNSPMAAAWRQDVFDDDNDNNNNSTTATATTTSTTAAVFHLHFFTDAELWHHLHLDRAQVHHILLQGARARDVLVRSNIKLVVGIAKKWARRSGSSGSSSSSSSSEGQQHSLYQLYSGGWDRPAVSEAVQEGILGLAIAAERYDPARKLRFATYATHWVTNYVRLCFQKATTGVLRVPQKFYELRAQYHKAVRRHYEADHGHVPPLHELAAELSVSPQRLSTVLRVTRPLLSTDAPLHAPVGFAEASSQPVLSDTLVDAAASAEDLVELSLLRQCLENAMASELLPHERDVLRLRLGLDDGVTRTCRQVSEEFYGGSLSTAEVRLAERRAFKKLRSPQSLSTYKLLHYIDFCGVDRETMTIR